jgi:hypothetical protein
MLVHDAGCKVRHGHGFFSSSWISATLFKNKYQTKATVTVVVSVTATQVVERGASERLESLTGEQKHV